LQGDPGPEGPAGPQGPSGIGAVRASAASTLTAVPAGADRRTLITLTPSYVVFGVATSVPARVRLYPSDASAAADLARPVDQEPATTAEIVMEFVTETGWLSAMVCPNVPGAAVDPGDPDAHLTVQNLSAGTSDVTVTLTYLALES
jgi:hypothetical protein